MTYREFICHMSYSSVNKLKRNIKRDEKVAKLKGKVLDTLKVVEKKKRDRLRYLTNKTSTLEHKLADLQQKQRLLALQGATLQLDTALAQQHEVKLVMQIRAMKKEFNSHMETSQY